MMKRSVPLLLLFLAGLMSGFGQITLTSDQNIPQEQYLYVFRTVQPSFGTAMITGEEVSWDFSGMNQGSDTSSVFYTRNPHYPSFQGISTILAYPDSTDESYLYSDGAIYRTPPNSFYLAYAVVTGWPYGTAVSNTFSKILTYPCSYATTIRSDSVYLSNTIGTPYIIVNRRWCDAWGELILPDSTYPSTLRISGYHYTETQINSHSCTGKITQTYEWYDEHSEVPLLSISRTRYFEGYCGLPVFTSTTLSAKQYIEKVFHPCTLGSAQPEPGLQRFLHPNPASGYVILDIPISGELTVCTLTGMIVMQQSYDGRKTTVDISTLTSGIYLVRLINQERVFAARLVKL